MNYAPKPELYPSLAPGTIIVLSDMTQLAGFEDTLVPLVDPAFDINLWQGRIALSEMLRPKVGNKPFNGRCTDISIKVLADPYYRMLECTEQGYKFQGSNGKKRESQTGQSSIDSYFGFMFKANMKSSGRAVDRSFDVVAFYAPEYRRLTRITGQQSRASSKNNEAEVKIRTSTVKKGLPSKAHDSDRAIIRFVSHPRYSEAPLV